MRLSNFRCRAAVGNAACRHMDIPIGDHWLTGVSTLAVCCLQQIFLGFSVETLFGALAASIDAAQCDALAMLNSGVGGK